MRQPKTYLVPNGKRPDRDSLSAALGFRVPEAFVTFLEFVHDQAGGDPGRAIQIFEELTGLFPSGAKARYPSTPCELFPIGSTGVDGDHYGYLVHAPELEMGDYPLCHYCPMDSDGVIPVEADTRHSLARILSCQLDLEMPHSAKWQTLTDMAAALGLQLTPAEADVSIAVPSDWTYLPSSDGVGVLAPSPLFSKQPPAQIDRHGQHEAFLTEAENEIREGYLATALYHLREGFWYCWTNRPIALCKRMCDVYEKLKRPSLAQVMASKIASWHKVVQ